MKLISNCLSCFGEQINRLMIKEESKRKIFLEFFKFSLKYKSLFEDSPVEIAKIIYKNKIVIDFFKKEKEKEILWSLKMMKKYEKELNKYTLIELLKIATAANVFDYASPDHINFENEIKKIKSEIDSKIFKGKMLYMTDNAAEIGFDILFLKKLKKEKGVQIELIVRQSDFINDLTLNDIKVHKLDKYLKEITDRIYGLDIYETSKAKSAIKISELENFKKSFDLVIAKGQANYEILTELNPDKRIIFALVAKCPVIARSVGIKEGTGIIKPYDKKVKENCK